MINKLYKKEKNYEKINIKEQISLEAEKYNLIKKTHTDNGHLGANRTVTKIIEKGYKGENITDDILEYIKYECDFYINERSGEKINLSKKILIAKSPKEHYVINGFELDEITKEKTGYPTLLK